MRHPAVSRRSFLQSAAGMAGAAALPAALAAPGQDDGRPEPGRATAVSFKVNGRVHDLSIEPRVTLLDALREQLGLEGTKKGCGRGQCGACTVLVNGRRINSCLSLAIMHANDEIVTIEGLGGEDGSLHPMQAAFLHHDAFQCGYCTPGQIVSAVALLEEHRKGADGRGALTDAAIREGLSGNICRCGAYPHIVAAVREVSA
jgi:xanthine dehydrogenase YagT iron-sulfur-binding subunit